MYICPWAHLCFAMKNINACIRSEWWTLNSIFFYHPKIWKLLNVRLVFFLFFWEFGWSINWSWFGFKFCAHKERKENRTQDSKYIYITNKKKRKRKVQLNIYYSNSDGYSCCRPRLISRTLESATSSSHGGIARAGIMVAGSAWGDTLASCTASPASPLAKTWPGG